MDELVKVALVGTAKVGSTSSDVYPTDELVANLAGSPEHLLLLRAGAAAIYHFAGQRQTDAAISLPEPAAPETKSVCSPALAALIDRMLSGDFKDLFPEALERLAATGHILPPDMLSRALDVKSDVLRGLIRPVIGNRGRWLSQFDEAWSWVADVGSEADAEQIWQEGTIFARCHLLQRLRATDPNRAREWLADVWKREKAPDRAKFLRTFETGLSLADEDFLESCLSDRGQEVRATTAALLKQLPGSQLSQRMCERAKAMLSLVHQAKKSRLMADPPMELDSDWQRDGIREPTDKKRGKRAEYVRQLLASVPPSHWQPYFEAEPLTLITASLDDTYAKDILDGWCEAAATFGDIPWMTALWDWAGQLEKGSQKKIGAKSLAAMMPFLGKLPADDAFARAEALMDGLNVHHADTDQLLEQLVIYLPRPWTADFTESALARWRRWTQEMKTIRHYTFDSTWERWLLPAAHAIPVACFDRALEPWMSEKDSERYRYRYGMYIEQFQELIHLRNVINTETT